MQTIKIFSLILCSLALLVLCFGISPVIAQKDSSYLEWLQKYGAWGVAQREIGKTSLKPQALLDRADLLLRLEEPNKTLELLDQYGIFSSEEMEAKRLWIKARASRMLGKHIQSLLWYSQAGELFTDKQFLQKLNNEPQLNRYWQDVWLYWFWQNFSGTRIDSEQGQKQLMLKAVDQALVAWPQDYLWEFARKSWSLAKWEAHSSFPEKSPFTVKGISSRDQHLILQALSALALNQQSKSKKLINNLSYSHLKSFWQTFLTQTEKNAQKSSFEQDASIFPKSISFWKVNAHLFSTLNSQEWILKQPDKSFWKSFTENLDPLTAQNALERIQKELSSTLLPPQIKKALQELAFAYSLLAENWNLAQDIWNQLDLAKLPLSLKLAGIVLFKEDPDSCFARNSAQLKKQFLLSELANAAGYNAAPLYSCPFWTQIPKEKLKLAHQTWPLDKMLNYSILSSIWQEKTSSNLAKRLSLLYPNSIAGQKALLFLAKKAHQAGKTNAAWEYITKVEMAELNDQTYLSFLEAKAGLEMELNRQKQSLRTYQKLLEIAPNHLPAVKRLKLALLAQRQGNWEWANIQLNKLWQERNDLSQKLQAETLFWLGEGAQHRGDLQKALDYYLRLAWKYPGEHIWAVTAMYRAALIYEQRGRLQTAKELLQTVIDRADRDSQKEAAKDRVKGIENKLSAQEPGKEGNWNFLF
jgi:hypothetical protein